LYDGDKECQVARLKITKGTNISPPIGDTVYLADSNDHLIDASSIPDGANVTISGIAGNMFTTDAIGGTPVRQKGVNANGAATPTIEIKSIDVATGEKVTLRIATPSTQP
jgi:hypothetical protein